MKKQTTAKYQNLCGDGRLPNDDIMNMIVSAFDDRDVPTRDAARNNLDNLGISPWDAVDALRLYRLRG
tara:strand:+ start:1587 stop:1790 length:204 start_codon:yes stop_codon:yes gene_type:complete